MRQFTRKLRDGQHTTLIALGDSNTALTFHTQGRLNWLGLLEQALNATWGSRACTVINAAHCGATIRQALDQFDQDRLSQRGDAVIVSFGINDANAGVPGLAPFARDARSLIERLRTCDVGDILIRTPNPIVAPPGLPLPGDARPGRPLETDARPVARYAAALIDVAADTGCDAVDHYTLWTNWLERAATSVVHPEADPNGLWPRMSDAIHPGPAGHMAFFREVAPALGVPARFDWEGAIDP